MSILRAEFEELECNRCGECCQGFTLSTQHNKGHDGPLGLLEMYCREQALGQTSIAFRPQDFMLFAGELIPVLDEPSQRWSYKCGYIHMEDEKGVCAIYDQRPEMCSAFPNGNPVTYYEQCVFNVEITE